MEYKLFFKKLFLVIFILQNNLFSMVQGSLDTNFNPTGSMPGIVTTGINTSCSINSVAIQQNGKIVVGGYTRLNGPTTFRFALARYNINGSLDNSFGTNGIVTTNIGSHNDRLNSIVLQPNGQIVAGGSTSNGSITQLALARYNSDGSLDNSFGTNGISKATINSFGTIYSIALQSNDKIVAGGYTFNGSISQILLARYNTDGSLDSTFGTNGIVITNISNYFDQINSIAIQVDGKIVTGGYSNNNIITQFALVRYNTDGSLDSTFGTNGIVITNISNYDDIINSIAIQANGQILAGGITNNNIVAQFALARYNKNGSLDNSFGINGIVTTNINNNDDAILSIALQSDGKIIGGGFTFTGSITLSALARYNINGSLDNSFGTNGIVTTNMSNINSQINSIAIQSNGYIVAGGISGSPTNFTTARYIAQTTLIQSPLTIAIKNKYYGDGA